MDAAIAHAGGAENDMIIPDKKEGVTVHELCIVRRCYLSDVEVGVIQLFRYGRSRLAGRVCRYVEQNSAGMTSPGPQQANEMILTMLYGSVVHSREGLNCLPKSRFQCETRIEPFRTPIV